jgi:hypothetical protein
MSINDATPQDWDRVRQTGQPTFEEYMKRLKSNYVYDSTENYGNEVTNDAGDFADCWDTGTEHRGLDAWMRAAHRENSELWEDESLEDIIARQDEEDMVSAPKHYNSGNIECIEAIEESMSSHAFKGYLKGNCMKYLWRYDYKGKQVEDLQKAGWYLNKLTKMVAEENS